MKYVDGYDLPFMPSFREPCVKKADREEGFSVNKVAAKVRNPTAKSRGFREN